MPFFNSLYHRRPEDEDEYFGGFETLEQQKQKGIGPSPSVRLPPDINLKPTNDPKTMPTQGLPEYVNYHPSDIPESAQEKLLKSTAKNFGYYIPSDTKYFEQYIHPDLDILERQELRPTKGGPPDPNMAYRKLHYFEGIKPSQKLLDDEWNKVITGKKDYFDPKNIVEIGRVPNLAGLGGHRYDTSNPEYDSAYDIYDFNTKTALAKTPMFQGPLDWAAKQFLERVGKPYTVYDRLPKRVQTSSETLDKLMNTINLAGKKK